MKEARSEASRYGKMVSFVTSFSPDLYEATGRRLMKSFLAQRGENLLLVCHEGLSEVLAKFDASAYVRLHGLDKDPLLHNWLKANRDIIPDYLGGTATHCDCPNWEVRHAKHKRGCHFQWMNRNASRWFRKIVSWVRASELAPTRYLIWLDCDCEVLKPVTVETVAGWFGGAAMFHFRGLRHHSDTGIVGFDLIGGGREFIQAVHQRYQSGNFRGWPRWDDCTITDSIIADGHFGTRDLGAEGKPGKMKISNIIPHTIVAPYFKHWKGSHGQKLGIMK